MKTAFDMTEITRVLHDNSAIVLLQSRVEHFADQTRLTTAAHTCHHCHHMQRKTNCQILQVVLARTFHLDIVIPMASLGRDVDFEPLRSRFALIHNFSAMTSGGRTDLNHMVRCGYDIRVMLHDNNRIP